MSIARGPIIQIAWVVDDIAATEKLLGEQFGVGSWTRIPDVHFGPDSCTVHGEPADFTAHISLAYAAGGTSDLQLELIQPVSGTSIYTEFLAASSPGLHHVCFEVDDIDVACATAEAAGLAVVQRGSMMDGAMDFAYVDGAVAGVPYVELARIGPDMAAFFADVKADLREAALMSERTALVTGAGKGSLGEATARLLRLEGFRVLTTTRSVAASSDTHALDLASVSSVTGFVDWVEGTTDRLDVLVNNAGIHLDLRSTWTSPQLLDGHEIHWRTNYLGTAHLTRLLLPLLTTTAREHGEARVVNVVSKLHSRGTNDALFAGVTPYDSWAAYGTSKLALIHETTELERRYGELGVHAYSPAPRLGLHAHRRPWPGDRARARPGAQGLRRGRTTCLAHARGGRAHDGLLCHLPRCRAGGVPP